MRRQRRRASRSLRAFIVVSSTVLLLPLVLGGCRHAPPVISNSADPRADPAPGADAPPAPRPPVGMTTRTLEPPTGGPVRATLWYPAVAGAVEEDISWDAVFSGRGARDAALRSTPERFPLVLLSHGSGGDPSNLAWLAETLASHGYVVAAVDHAGDRLGDSSVEGRFAVWRRPAEVTRVLSSLLADPSLGPRIDRRRIAAAGHSSGGTTVLELAGARVQPRSYLGYCGGPQAGPDCARIAGLDVADLPDLATAARSHRDRRVRAVVAFAPVLGPAAIDTSLRSIAVPVEIVASPDDEVVPFRSNAARYARLIPGANLATLPEGGHFVFLPVCAGPGSLVAAEVCKDGPRVDRAAIHARVGDLVVAFLDQALRVSRIRPAPPRSVTRHAAARRAPRL